MCQKFPEFAKPLRVKELVFVFGTVRLSGGHTQGFHGVVGVPCASSLPYGPGRCRRARVRWQLRKGWGNVGSEFSAWADSAGTWCSGMFLVWSPKSRNLCGIRPWFVAVPVPVASGAQASQTSVSYPGSSWERCSEGGSAKISDPSHWTLGWSLVDSVTRVSRSQTWILAWCILKIQWFWPTKRNFGFGIFWVTMVTHKKDHSK